ncbi:GH12 family glycosyl hydrolase domain-containing protein [Glycomyces buryatensis]|uniref:Glycosyl hydrolase n=1 Tax=Glycomyces buryatensis TaxID=2570927 RepID=A0A4S8Q2U4_9ACTN|nr:hypothetical protein [Glycomyces buryatensis]THV38428.1 hypothetical protein FAB82_18430 [Glycomyces buryatensis]
MRRRSLLTAALAAPVATVATVGGLASPAQAANWSSSAQYGQWNTGPYTLYNNIWGRGAGYQSIWANSQSNWGVWADHPNTGGIKSYPNVSYTLGRDVWSMGNVSSSFNVSNPSGSGLAYNTAYDVWGNGHAHEVMIWTQWTSNVGPIGGYVTNVNLGGRNWNYHQGHNGGNHVYSFMATSQFTSGTVNITPICQWLVSQGRMPRVRIDQIQFGWEITSSAGGRNFNVNNYSLTT